MTKSLYSLVFSEIPEHWKIASVVFSWENVNNVGNCQVSLILMVEKLLERIPRDKIYSCL